MTSTAHQDPDRSAIIADAANADLGATILRVAMGGLFIAHGWLQLAIFTPAGTAALFESLGFPGSVAYLVMAAEFAGGIALILGLWTQWVSLSLVPVLLGAINAPHGAAGLFFLNEGGGWELPALWALALVVQALPGNGADAPKRNRAWPIRSAAARRNDPGGCNAPGLPARGSFRGLGISGSRLDKRPRYARQSHTARAPAASRFPGVRLRHRRLGNRRTDRTILPEVKFHDC